MNDSLQLYRTLFTVFCQQIPRRIFRDLRRLMVLAWAVVGLCLTKTANFSQWGEVVISEAHYARSHQRRFHNWLHNARVRPIKLYSPLLQAALREWASGMTLYLALDTSDLHNGYILMRLSLIYRGRAVPVTWRIMRHSSTSVSYRHYKGLLYQALLILPPAHPVVLLADRGFVQAQLVKFARREHWGLRLRVKANTLVRLADRRVVNMRSLCPSGGHAHFYQDIQVLGEHLGPVNLALANPTADDEEPWYIITDAPAEVSTLDEYALRFDTEEEFLDDKSGGFQVEASRLDNAKALERLFLVIAVATLHCPSVGSAVVQRQTRRWVDTHWDRGLSYFQIGWRWLRQQFRRRWPVLPPLGLDPAPDPEPAHASRQQAARAPRQWVISCFGKPR